MGCLRGLAVLFAGLFFALAGCAPRVYPPLNPANPTTIYVCDYGIHSSLLLPSGEGQFVEYVYGDWDFAALNKTDPLHTLIALFGSCQPALGRRYLRPARGTDVPSPPNPPHTMEPMAVDGERVKRVVREMNRRFRKHIATAWLNDWPNYFFTFVY